MAKSDTGRTLAADGMRFGRRRLILGAGAVMAAPMVSLPFVKPALAHHGWPGFDTDHLLYIAGTVSSNGV